MNLETPTFHKIKTDTISIQFGLFLL